MDRGPLDELDMDDHTGDQPRLFTEAPSSEWPGAGPGGTSSGLVRPYFRTSGRTHPTRDLAVEALISTTKRGRSPRPASAEHRAICELCRDTRSVAEVAAHLRIPLGVARVIISDMADLELVVIHERPPTTGGRPSIEFMERVLTGLNRL